MAIDVLGLGTEATVRPGVPSDAAAVAAIMIRCYRADYPGVLPPQVLAAMTADQLTQAWRAALTGPPTERHRVFVAGAGAGVVGFAAIGPSQDGDAGPDDGELLALEVDPVHRRSGHGSRLLATCVDLLREQRITTLRIWLLDGDQARRAFLTSAGMADDGARRHYPDADLALTQVRFAAELTAPA